MGLMSSLIVSIVCSSDRFEIRVILLAKSIEPDLDFQGKRTKTFFLTMQEQGDYTYCKE